MTNTRPQRIGMGAVVVVVAFWAYRLVAVPLIEPPLDETPVVASDRHRVDVGDSQIAELKPYFAPGSWELDHPIVLEGEQFKLLFKEYQTTPDGKVNLTPCTVVFLPGAAPAVTNARQPRFIIMEAPQGALLEFDKPLDLSRMQIGHLKGGVFAGAITIHGRGSVEKPGQPVTSVNSSNPKYAGDDLLITTRDVQMSDNRIWTPHDVDMQFGANTVHGRDLRMDMQSNPAGKKSGIGLGTLQAFELGREVSMHLQPGAGGFLPGDKPVAKDLTAPAAATPAAPPLPVDVRCQGPFRFDLLEYVATFEERVDVLRASRAGPSDQLQCELLSIYFQPKRTADGAVRPKSGVLPPLEPRRFEAKGRPVIVRAPSTGGNARGERLDYDIQTGKLILEASDEVQLQQKNNEIHARSVVYQRDEHGALQRVVAVGPGWLRGSSGDAGNSQFEGHFETELRVRPQEQTQVASLSGNATLNFSGQGSIRGDEIHIWFLPPPKKPATQASHGATASNAGGLPAMMPDRLLAQGAVKILSPQLNGATPRLEVWFKPAVRSPLEADRLAAARAARAPGGSLPSPFPAAAQQNPLATALPPAGQPSSPLTGAGAAGALAASPATTAPATTGAALQSGVVPGKSHFDVAGDLIRAQFLLYGQATELDDLSIDGHVVLNETQTPQPGERPMIIRGEQLQVLKAQSPGMSMSIAGQPGFVDARGLTLEGQTIRMNREQNRLWIDGAGRMVLPIDRDSEGRPLKQPTSLAITWKERMQFDGLTARYDRDVLAQTDERMLRTEMLAVTMAQRVDFAAPQAQQRPQVEWVVCQGGANLENRTIALGQVVSVDRLQLRDLTLQQSTGAISGNGPGVMTSWRHGGANLPGQNIMPVAAGTTAATSASVAAKPNDQLNYVNVQFQRGMTGNMHNRELTFSDRVKTIYGPVKSWSEKLDPDSTAGLGPQDMLLTSDQLRISQPAAQPNVKPSTEIEAIGNTRAEGATYTANAYRVSYAQAKDMLILEGDGRSDAQLYRQEVVGGPQSQAIARRILYYPATRRAEVDDAHFLDLGQLGSQSSAKAATDKVPSTAAKPKPAEKRKR